MSNIKSVTPLNNHKLKITFETKETFEFDVTPYLFGEVFTPLKNVSEFQKVTIDPQLKTITWPTGADFCSDFIYKQFQHQN